MKEEKLYQRIARLIAQNQNCVERNNTEWEERSRAELNVIAKNYLPSGSGIDCGTKIDLDSSDRNRVVLLASFHHMNENGFYDGWTEHAITIVPDLAFGFTLKISGRNRNDIKDYLHEVFESCLNESYEVKPATA